MKFWNKSLAYRKSWHRVKSTSVASGQVGHFFFDERKIWCQNNGGDKKFYFTGNMWFFENAEDATNFKLKWG